MIRVENLHKSFGNLEVLKGVNEHIKKGEVVSIIGASGGGKSTFLRCLNLLEVPEQGSIYFDGVDIVKEKTNIDIHRQKMGMVFQHFNVFPHKTVLENITLAPIKLKKKTKSEAISEAEYLLETVGLLDKKNEYPRRLSGGQKQRVSIAGVIAMHPQCIVFEEPTAMLDPKGREEVMNTILLLKELGITVVLITHYMNEAVMADRVAVMDNGNVLTVGTPREVFSQVNLLKKHSLDVPQATELAYKLSGVGVKFDKMPLNTEECVEFLEGVLK